MSECKKGKKGKERDFYLRRGRRNGKGLISIARGISTCTAFWDLGEGSWELVQEQITCLFLTDASCFMSDGHVAGETGKLDH